MSAVSAPPHSTPTVFRLAVQAALAEKLPFPVIPGRVDGPQKRRPLCCVYPLRRIRPGDHVLEEDIVLGVRVWPRWQDAKDPDRPIDPTKLEEASEQLLAALSAVQTSLGPWYVDVQSLVFDVEGQGIEATVAGRQWNPFAMCEEG